MMAVVGGGKPGAMIIEAYQFPLSWDAVSTDNIGIRNQLGEAEVRYFMLYGEGGTVRNTSYQTRSFTCS